MSYMGFAEKR